MSHYVSPRFNLGAAKDTIGDGVTDKKDKCPGTQAWANVDDVGCILDRDKDGIADDLDECLIKGRLLILCR